MNSDRWDLVARWLKRQISERGLSKAAIVREVRMDQRTLDRLLAGEAVAREDRLAALAAFLGYRGDAFDMLRQGEEPIPLGLTAEEADLRFRALERRLDRIEAVLEGDLSPPDPPRDAQ